MPRMPTDLEAPVPLARRSILIFAYYSYADPVFQSAVLPYFLNLAEGTSLDFVLMTFEQEQFALDLEAVEKVESELASHRIEWISSKWHSGRFKPMKKAYDFIRGFLYALWLVQRRGLSVVYSEGFPGAIIGHHIARASGVRHVVHSFEPHADAMVEGGVWKSTSWEARLLKFYERCVAFGCTDILTATGAYAELWKARGCNARFYRAPSCVDTTLFQFCPDNRTRVRDRLGIQDSDRVVVYLGKMGGMYWSEEIGVLFNHFYTVTGGACHFLVLTGEPPKVYERVLTEIPPTHLTVLRAGREEVPHYLSAADAGLCAVKQEPSKRYCSPIKDGEYWACGLPILIPREVSDDFLFVEEHQIGVVISDTSAEGLMQAACEMMDFWRRHSPDEIRKRARDFAIRDRSVCGYQPLLKKILSGAPVED